MEETLGIFKGIIKSDFLYLYLEAIKENQSFRAKNISETDEIILTINGFLTKQKTRELGLQLLKYFLPQCTRNKFEQKANFWCIHVLKACNTVEILQNASLIFDVLEILARKCHNYPELSKMFSSTYLTKIYDALTLLPSIGEINVLSCIKTCLELYPGPSAQSQSLIERILYKNPEAMDKQIIFLVGVCLLLLQQVRRNQAEGGTFKTQWYNYHINLIGQSNSILNELYDKHLPILKLNAEEDTLIGEKIELSKGPVNSIGQLYLRFHNVVSYITIAIRAPFPAPKRIMPKKILNFIQRGLSITINQLTRSGVYDNMALAAFIPKIHIDLLELLEAMILTLGCHLKVYASFIMDLLADVLNCSSLSQSCNELKRPRSNLRMKAYNIITLWCKTLQHGSFSEYYAERLIAEIFTDTCPSKVEITLKVLSGTRKHLTKKARRQLNKSQNEQSSIGQTHSYQGCTRNESSVQNENANLCVIAQRCLQQILISSSFLKPALFKSVQIKLLQSCSLFTELPLNKSNLYFTGKCRIEIYNTLKTLLLTRHYLTPASVEMIYSTIKSGQFYDKNAVVRNHCGSILKNLEHFIHPEKEGFGFSTNIINVDEELCLKNKLLNELGACDHREYNGNNPTEVLDEQNDEIVLEMDDFIDSSTRTFDDFNEDDLSTSSPTTAITTTTENLMNTLELEKNVEIVSTKNCLIKNNKNDEKLKSNISTAQKVNEISANNSSEEVQYEPISKKLKSSCTLDDMNTNRSIVNDDALLAEIQSSFVDELS